MEWVWRAEDNLSVLFFHHVVPGIKLRLSDLPASSWTHEEENGEQREFSVVSDPGGSRAVEGQRWAWVRNLQLPPLQQLRLQGSELPLSCFGQFWGFEPRSSNMLASLLPTELHGHYFIILVCCSDISELAVYFSGISACLILNLEVVQSNPGSWSSTFVPFPARSPLLPHG